MKISGAERVMEDSNHTPLLEDLPNSVNCDDRFDHDKPICLSSEIWRESKKLWQIVGPAIFFRASNFSMIIITQAVAGHLGDLELAAISLSYNVIIGLDFGLLLGMASALETLCGQGFGAKKYSMLGIYLQRAWVVLFLFSLPMLPIFIFAGPIMRLMGQAPAVAELTGVVARWMIPLHFCLAFLFPVQRFLQCQLKNLIIAAVSFAVLLVHVLLCWAALSWIKFGVTGLAIALSCSWWLLCLALIIYVLCGGCPSTWELGFSFEAFFGLWEFAKLSVASGVMICLENWYYRILILIAGTFSNSETDLDAVSICMSINSWQMMIPLSFFAAAGVRVANELGAGDGKGAKFAAKMAVITSATIGVLCWLIIMLFNDKVALLFSSSEVVLEAVNRLKLLLAFTVLLNSVQPVLSGVAVGSGWQSYVAFVNLGCYYIIGVPLGYLLGFPLGLGIKGLWIGMIFGGAGVQTVILAIMVGCCNWEKEAEKVGNRKEFRQQSGLNLAIDN